MLKGLAVAFLGSLVLVGVLFFSFIVALIFAFPLQLAWNYVMPYLFGFKIIGFWHAFCLIVVANLLVKGGSSSSSNNSKD